MLQGVVTICQYDPPIVVGLLLAVWECLREQAANKKGSS